jgi:hypothetical protein
MSASGPKRTSLVALHMSALGGKADMLPLKKIRLDDCTDRFWDIALAAHMSACDPKRTLAGYDR